jgi:hypothetical protein
MPQLLVKKAVAVCFLEAAKASLEHLGAWRLERSEQGVALPPEVTRLYADVRRVRDYLQRCAMGYGEDVELDFDATDAAVLVACCRRAIDDIDGLVENVQTGEERQALERRHQLLGDWIVELAARPLVELPLRRERTASPATRAVVARVHTKLYGEMKHRALFKSMGAGGVSSMMLGLPSFDEAPPPAADDDDEKSLGTDKPARTLLDINAMLAAEDRDEADAAAASAGGADAENALLHDLPPDDGDEAPLTVESTVPAAATLGTLPAEAPLGPRSVSSPTTRARPSLFDAHTLREPRLRALMQCDLATYERAFRAEDYRLATIMLGSVLESVLLDHVLPRRAEFGLSGAPESWNLQDLLVRALGDLATPRDRSLAHHLFASRNLLRPAVQVMTPAVVTVSSFELMREFVERALHGLGYGAAELPPPRTPPADG